MTTAAQAAAGVPAPLAAGVGPASGVVGAPASAAAGEGSGDPEDPAALRQELLSLLQRGAPPADPVRVQALITALERLRPADLGQDQPLLAGVWELRWSSSALPYLAVAPWLENLQLLDPARGLGMNLLRPAGPVGPLAGIAVQAELTLEPSAVGQRAQRVGVRFRRGGWLGPQLGGQRLSLLREVKQSFPAWLDITVLDDRLRVCRGQAGTLFALVRREDLRLRDLMP